MGLRRNKVVAYRDMVLYRAAVLYGRILCRVHSHCFLRKMTGRERSEKLAGYSLYISVTEKSRRLCRFWAHSLRKLFSRNDLYDTIYEFSDTGLCGSCLFWRSVKPVQLISLPLSGYRAAFSVSLQCVRSACRRFLSMA